MLPSPSHPQLSKNKIKFQRQFTPLLSSLPLPFPPYILPFEFDGQFLGMAVSWSLQLPCKLFDLLTFCFVCCAGKSFENSLRLKRLGFCDISLPHQKAMVIHAALDMRTNMHFIFTNTWICKPSLTDTAILKVCFCDISRPHQNAVVIWERDSSVVKALDSWLKGCGFESLQEQQDNFLLQGQLSVLTLILVSVPSPCYRSSM